MHWAQLKNYLGVEDQHGSKFQEMGRKQVAEVGGKIRDERGGDGGQGR